MLEATGDMHREQFECLRNILLMLDFAPIDLKDIKELGRQPKEEYVPPRPLVFYVSLLCLVLCFYAGRQSVDGFSNGDF